MATTQIRSAQILDGTIVAADLASDSVTTVKILDSNVTAGKLASDSVTTVKILNGNVTVAKLSDLRVTDAGVLDVDIAAGTIRNDATVTHVSADTLTLADDDTSYVEVNNAGVISSNLVGFTAGSVPLATVVTASGDIVSVTDERAWLIVDQGFYTTSNFVDNEVPSGDLDGVDVTYTLAFAPSPAGSLHVYKNGLRLTEGGGNDYTLATLTITFTSAPISTDMLLADYRK
jgi:hypothetical protein